MGLESGNYVSDLVASNPVGTDKEHQGDNHLRLIKAVLKNTFPNANRAFRFPNFGVSVTSTYTVIASDDGRTIAVDCTGGAVTVNLIASPPHDGFTVEVRKTDDSGNQLTIQGNGNDIDNGSSLVVGSNYTGYIIKWFEDEGLWLAIPVRSGVTYYIAGGTPVALADIASSTTAKRILAATTATDWSEHSIEQILNFFTSIAHGDILFRGSSGFQRLPAGTDGEFLQTRGTGVDVEYSFPLVPASNYAAYTAATGIGTDIPYDDTIPEIDEGTEILSATITPVKASSKIRATFQGHACVFGGSTHVMAALFKDGAENAVRATAARPESTDREVAVELVYEFSPASTAEITFSVRVGADGAGSIVFNGTSAGRRLGGSAAATLVLEEIFTA